MFAIRHKDTKEFLTWEVWSNKGAPFANGCEVILTVDGDAPAVFNDRGTAERALEYDTPWYNASFTYPSRSGTVKGAEWYEVVELLVIK